MKLKIIITLLLTFFNAVVCAQLSKKQKDSVGIATQVDYQQMLKAIGVSNVRPGPSGNGSASNPANIDESKATTYTSLPNPLIFKNGSKVNSSKLWTKRRLEILEDFDREIYGRVPKNIPKVKWKVISLENGKQGEIPVHIKRLIGEVGKNVNIELTLTTPALAKRAVPIIMEFGFSFPQAQNTSTQNSPDWKQQLINKGWGFAILSPRSIQADNGAGLTQGIIGLVNKGEFRKPEWVDAKGMFLGAALASPVYELLGKKGLGTFEFPQMETFLGGDLAFRQHTGGHTAGPNWSTFIAFAAKYFEK